MKKPIAITFENRDAIEASLEAVNGRAQSFTVNNFYDVKSVADDAEKKISALPKADRVGARCVYVPAGASSKAYKYAAKSTRIEMERKRTGWVLIDVKEASIYPRDSEKMMMNVSRFQRDEIARRAVADFCLINNAEAV